jgi:hypothetical protein
MTAAPSTVQGALPGFAAGQNGETGSSLQRGYSVWRIRSADGRPYISNTNSLDYHLLLGPEDL